MSSMDVLKSIQLDSDVVLEVRVDKELNAVLAVLKTSVKLSADSLSKVSEQLRSCYGEEFTIVDLDGAPHLVKILLIQSSEASSQLIEQIVKSLTERLKECKVLEMLSELIKEARRRTSRYRKSGKK